MVYIIEEDKLSNEEKAVLAKMVKDRNAEKHYSAWDAFALEEAPWRAMEALKNDQEDNEEFDENALTAKEQELLSETEELLCRKLIKNSESLLDNDYLSDLAAEALVESKRELEK